MFGQWEEFLTTIFRNGLPSVPVAPQFSSVTQSCPTLGNPMNCSTPGLSVHHQLPEFTQTHAHQVGDAIQPSHPLSSPSPAFNLSQHQGLFKWIFASGGQSIGVSASTSVLPVNIQDWFLLGLYLVYSIGLDTKVTTVYQKNDKNWDWIMEGRICFAVFV